MGDVTDNSNAKEKSNASSQIPIDSQDESSPSDYLYNFLFQVQPVHLILFGSIPLCMGAYGGYRLEMNRIASAAASSSSDSYSPGSTASGGGLLRRVMGEELKSRYTSTKLSTANSSIKDVSKKSAAAAVETLEMKQIRSDIGRIAFKALGIGSMLSIGGVGLLTAGIFKLSGCDSLQEMIGTWREWTPRKRRQLENAFGVEPKSLKHEDVIATKGMTEGEEWEFIKKKYIPELVDDNEE